MALYTKYCMVAVFMVLPFLLNPTMTSESVYTAVSKLPSCQDIDNLIITLTTMMTLHRLEVKVNDRQFVKPYHDFRISLHCSVYFA